MTIPDTADVCVAGGGPAGSVVAARLAQLGFVVCLVERACFPRPRLGESLSPGVLPLLETIGARRDIEASGFTRVRRVWSNWEGVATERVDPHEQGLLVDRGRFDTVLLARARALGVAVMQPAVVRERLEDDAGWNLVVETGGNLRRLRARFFVDASGRAGALPPRRRRRGPRTVALYAYWRGRLPAQPRIDAAPNAWCWSVPLPDGSCNTLAFVDAASLKGRSRDAYFHELIGQSALMDGCQSARMAGGIFVADATPYVDESSVTPLSIKVGDAAMAIDPLSSSGVQKAIQTALSGAIVVNTLLRKKEYAEAALRFYRDGLDQASDRHRAWARLHYARVAARIPTRFWADRAGPPSRPLGRDASPGEISAQMVSGASLRLSPDAVVKEVPRLESDFVSVGPALCHPALDAPVAFVGGLEVAPLLREVRDGITALQLVRSWTPGVSFESGLAIAGWMLGRGILVAGEARQARLPTDNPHTGSR